MENSRRDVMAGACAVAAMTFSPAALAAWEPSQRYPDPAIQSLDPSFNKYRIALAGVERLANGCRFNEGAVYFGDARCLLWSDIPNNRIMRWDEETGRISTFRQPCNHANGNTRDRQGRLVTCEHSGRRITRTEYDGTITVLIDRFGGNGEKDGQYLKFTRDGKFVLQIGKQGDQTDSNDVTRLGKPADAEVDPETNEVYIADGYFNHRVIVFDADSGAYKRHWGAYGKKPTDEKLEPYNSASSQFGNPVHCVKIAKDGLVYVCDRANNRLQVFRKDGSFVKEFAYEKNTRASGSVWDLDFWIDGKQTYLFNADGTNNEVRTLVRESGEVVSAFGRNGRNAGEFHWVHNLAIDSKGNLYTTEVDTGKRAQKFRYVGPAVAK